MTAPVIFLPVAMRPSFDSLDWCEQYQRESFARADEIERPPPRTRLLLVINNEPDDRAYLRTLLRLRDALKDE